MNLSFARKKNLWSLKLARIIKPGLYKLLPWFLKKLICGSSTVCLALQLGKENLLYFQPIRRQTKTVCAAFQALTTRCTASRYSGKHADLVFLTPWSLTSNFTQAKPNASEKSYRVFSLLYAPAHAKFKDWPWPYIKKINQNVSDNQNPLSDFKNLSLV